MPASSAVLINDASAEPDIMVPVGLAGLAISTPFSGVLAWAASSISLVIAQRVCSVVSIGTHSQPSALRI